MSAPKRIQQKRVKGWRKPEGAVSVTRATKWGNPFIVGHTYKHVATRTGRTQFTFFVPNRKVATDLFRAAMLGGSADLQDGEGGAVWFETGGLDVNKARAELAGKDLMCFCPLDQPCHADVLLDLANKEPGA